jgi:hypothetical protein
MVFIASSRQGGVAFVVSHTGPVYNVANMDNLAALPAFTHGYQELYIARQHGRAMGVTDD